MFHARRAIVPLALTLALTLALALLAGCAREDTRHRTAGHVFGTKVDVTIYGGSAARAGELSAQVLAEFDRLHHKLHAWQPGMLTALNDSIAAGKPFAADAELVYLLRSAAALEARSDGLFNPTIGHLIRQWGFQTSTIGPQAPAEQDIRHWVDAHPSLADLRYDGTTITSVNPAVMIDLGGFAKGYALDRAAAILRAAHVRAALVNIGGNVLAIGQPGAQPWQVGIRDPRGTGTLVMVPLHDNEAMGTSGDYERYFMKDGKRRPHIIDPRTGYPIDVTASVTIVTSGGNDAGLRSDGNSKPLFITGPGEWHAMADRLGLKEVLLVDPQRRVAVTPALRARLRARLR